MDHETVMKKLKNALQTHELSVARAKGLYSLKEYRDKLPHNEGAVWAVQCLIKEFEECAAPIEPKPKHGRFEPLAGSHYTGD